MPSQIDSVLRALDRDVPLDVALARLSPSRFRTLMLHVYRQRADRPLAALRSQQKRMPALDAGPLDARINHQLEALVWQAFDPGYPGVSLAPVGPFGSAHVLAGTPQDNLTSGGRALEVIGDPTVQLALLAAEHREQQAHVRLASVSRALRMQPLASPSHTQHFQIACMVTSARALPDERFEAEALQEQLTALLRLIGLARERYRIGPVQVALTDMRLLRGLAADAGIDLSRPRATLQQELDAAGLPRFVQQLELATHAGLVERLARLAERLRGPLQAALPGVELGFDLGRARQITYFEGFAFHVWVGLEDGMRVPIADGGLVDWVARLRSDRRERTLTSGIGIELLHRLFAPV